MSMSKAGEAFRTLQAEYTPEDWKQILRELAIHEKAGVGPIIFSHTPNRDLYICYSGGEHQRTVRILYLYLKLYNDSTATSEYSEMVGLIRQAISEVEEN